MFYTHLQAPGFPCDKLSASRYFLQQATEGGLYGPHGLRGVRGYRQTGRLSSRPQIHCPQLSRVLFTHIFASIIQFSVKHVWELRTLRGGYFPTSGTGSRSSTHLAS